MNLAKPHFKGEEALQLWLEEQLDRVLWDFVSQFEDKGDDGNLLEKLEAVGDGPEGILQLGGILGRQRANFSWEELREDAYQSDYSHDEQIYRQVKALEGDPHALSKLGAILKPSPYSAEELLDEYVSEKYGV